MNDVGMRHVLTAALVVALGCGGQVVDPPETPKATVTGKVTKRTGTFGHPASFAVTPIEVDVYFYPLVTLCRSSFNHVDERGKPLAKTRSRPDGTFSVDVPVGKHSALVDYKGALLPWEWRPPDCEQSPVVVTSESSFVSIEIDLVVD